VNSTGLCFCLEILSAAQGSTFQVGERSFDLPIKIVLKNRLSKKS
jgi:hypothetical protein